MSHLSCSAGIVIGQILRVFWLLMIVYAIVSWVPSLQGRWSSVIARVIEPVLQPLRRVIPPIGGLDLSFLVVIILVSYLINAIPRAACAYYF